MISLKEHDSKLAAIEVLLLQLYIQNFRNTPGRAADETLTDWLSRAVQVVSDDPDAANYIREFYSYVRSEIDGIRQKA